MAGRRNSYPGFIIVLCAFIIAGTVAFVFWTKAQNLKEKEKEVIQQEELLNKQIEEQHERTGQLEEEKKYVKTDEFIEDEAREKLGLIYPNEYLFEEKEGD